jgi:hypothetical protein
MKMQLVTTTGKQRDDLRQKLAALRLISTELKTNPGQIETLR